MIKMPKEEGYFNSAVTRARRVYLLFSNKTKSKVKTNKKKSSAADLNPY